MLLKKIIEMEINTLIWIHCIKKSLIEDERKDEA